MKKKGIIWGPLIQILLGIIVITLVILSLNKPLFTQVKSFFAKEEFRLPEEEFVPFDQEYAPEEQTVVDSMNAVIRGINFVATKGEDIMQADNTVDSFDNAPYSYRISFAAYVDIEEDGLNDYREWVFEKEFKVIKDKDGKIIRQNENKIMADYYYGSCNNDNEDRWLSCSLAKSGDPLKPKQSGQCYCHDEDDRDSGFEEMDELGIRKAMLDEAKKKGLAPIRDLIPLYNIVLTTYDKAGNEICKAGTWNQVGKITDRSLNDLKAWKENEDRNGNGIKGSYAEIDWGKDWWEVLPSGFTKDDFNSDEKKAMIRKYFPNGKVHPQGIGEGCLDSPTWIECPGIRAFYCGKYGLESGVNGQPEEYYYRYVNDELHSRSGIKILTDISSNYTGKYNNMIGYSSENRGDDKKILVRDSDGQEAKDFIIGAKEYAKNFDVYIISSVIDPFMGETSLNMKKMSDPKVYCYGSDAEKYGNTLVKCDPDFGGCGICNFELPQNISDDYDMSSNYIAGYGDPKYIMYYEAFPIGEESAWTMDVATLSLGSLVAINLASGATAVIPGSTVAKMLGKAGSFLGKVTVVPAMIVQGIKLGVKPFVWGAKLTKEGIEAFSRRVSVSIRSVFKKESFEILNKEAAQMLLIRSFDDGRTVLKYLDAEDIKLVANLDEVVKLVEKNNVDELRALADLLKDEKVLTSFNAFKQDLPSSIAKKGSQYLVAYGIALASAREDSMNQKFEPIGINAIGAKEPYKGALTTGAGLDPLHDDAEKYYIALMRDKYKGGPITNIIQNQNMQRFFIASPCKADIAIVKSECQCWESKEESVKVPENLTSTYGNISFLNYTLNYDYGALEQKRYESGVKVCRDRSSGFDIITLENPIQKTECIIVNPVLADDTFCYSGSHSFAEIGKYAVFAGTIAGSVATEAAAGAITIGTGGFGTGVAVGVKIASGIGIEAFGMYLANEISKTEKWPNH